MYLERVKAKGRHYLYLREYDASIEFAANKKRTLYRFGRIDKALKDILSWHKDINKLPKELKVMNCTRKDLATWIRYIEELQARSLSPHSTQYYMDYSISSK